MKPRSPSAFNTLALAFASVELPALPPGPALRRAAPSTIHHPPSTRSYPTPPWRTSRPTIQPPAPPLAASWTVETHAFSRKVYIDAIDKLTGQPCVIPMTLLTHHAVLTSATGHSYELTAMPGKGSSIKRLDPREVAARDDLTGQIAAIQAAPESIKVSKKGKESPCLSDDQKAEVAALRACLAVLGTRHLPDAIRADLTLKLGATEAAATVAFLLP